MTKQKAKAFLQRIRMQTTVIDYLAKDMQEQLEKVSNSIKNQILEISKALNEGGSDD